MQPSPVRPVKYFIGALYSDEALLTNAIAAIEEEFGVVDLISQAFNFTLTTYYDAEMGIPIFRQFFAFSKLAGPDLLASAKLLSNAIEDKLRVAGQRKVNMDIGYLDYDKVVLASAKYGIHKVCLAQGIYADLALHYEKGQFHPYDWTFQDFKLPDYRSFFMSLREIYKRQINTANR